MKFYLIVAKGSKKGMPYEITMKGDLGLFLIGSKESCQLKAPNLLPEQCLIRISRREVAGKLDVFIKDLNDPKINDPKAGLSHDYKTLVNDSVMPPGEEWPLHAGDRIAFGKLEFMIQYREKPLSQKDLEEWAAKCLDITNEMDLFDEGADEYHEASNASAAAQNIIGRLTAQRGVVMGRFRIGRESGVTTVRFTDAKLVEEAEVAYIKKELCEHLDRPNLRVLLDCKNVKRMSTTAVSMFREFHKWLGPRGGTMALCRVRADILPVVNLMIAGDGIPLFPDKKSAYLAQW